MYVFSYRKMKLAGFTTAAALCLLVGTTQVRAERVDLGAYYASPGVVPQNVDVWVDVTENASRNRYEFTLHNDSDAGLGSAITSVYFHRDLTDAGLLLSRRGVNNSAGTTFGSGASPAVMRMKRAAFHILSQKFRPERYLSSETFTSCPMEPANR